jgi:hypothetical protein
MAKLPIIFLDMRERELKARRDLTSKKNTYEAAKKKRGLTPEQEADLERITNLLASPDAVDPAFKAVQADFRATGQDVGDDTYFDSHGIFVAGVLPSQQPSGRGGPEDNEIALAAAYGILERNVQTDPGTGAKFYQALAAARGEFNAYKDLFRKVLGDLIRQSASDEGREIRADQWASVVQSLVRQGATAADPYLGVKALFALAGQEGVNDSAPPSSIEIDPPDLDAVSAVEVVRDNLIAMQGLYFASMFDEMLAWRVRDKLVELFISQQLPLGRGNAGNLMFSLWKQSANRFTETDRRNLYALAFGATGGEPTHGPPNTEFVDVLPRFISTVAQLGRQLTVDDLLRQRAPGYINQEQVKKAGRDLAGNLSLHAYGIAYFAATELQTEIKEIITLLSDPEILGAYGAKDIWGVIDQVSSLELGGSKNTVKYRTMATSGAVIIRWLANNSDRLTAGNITTVLDIDAIRNPPARQPGTKPTLDPSDRDLVDACEAWLAVTGTPEDRVESYSQPSEAPAFTSLPVRIPAAAKEMLESVGVKPMSYVNGAPRMLRV